MPNCFDDGYWEDLSDHIPRLTKQEIEEDMERQRYIEKMKHWYLDQIPELRQAISSRIGQVDSAD